jgi:hypothetical protein
MICCMPRTLLLGFATALLAASPARAQAPLFDHSAWDAVLAAHVSARGVDYAGLQANRATLDEYVRGLGTVDATTFDAWPRAEQVAYLINAYNALVLASVIDKYPIRRSLRPAALVRPANSIWQIAGFFDGIRHRAAGRELTLDDIEHRWLRDVLAEPRVHFALVCAARSCPPLREAAFVAARLDEQLDDQARRFFRDPGANQFDRGGGRVRLSSILKWFGEDFERFAPAAGFTGSAAERGALAFAARFLPAETARWLETGRYRIEYLDYDWSLNDSRR